MKNEKLWEETKTSPKKAEYFERGSGHSSLFAHAFYVWGDSKILGIGYKNFYNQSRQKKLTRETTHPHNYYLDVLVSTGLVGFTILIGFFSTHYHVTCKLFISKFRSNM